MTLYNHKGIIPIQAKVHYFGNLIRKLQFTVAYMFLCLPLPDRYDRLIPHLRKLRVCANIVLKIFTILKGQGEDTTTVPKD
jgi:hypothetical protein